MRTSQNKIWIFVIDTEQYAGNFERPMCAYVTGQLGECGVGEEHQKLFIEETDDKYCELFENVISIPDDDGHCQRPCSIYITEGWFNNGYGGHFKEGTDQEAFEIYIKFSTAHHNENIKNTQKIKEKLLKGERWADWTIEDCDRDIKREEKSLQEEISEKKLPKYPAYQSVAIYFENKPSDEQIKLMKERSYKFNAASKKLNNKENIGYRHHQEDVVITGFRLLVETTSVTEEKESIAI